MEELLKKKVWISLLFVFAAIVTEFVSFLVMGLGAFPVYWGIDLAYILIFGMILFVLPGTIPSICVGGLILALQMVVGFINEALIGMSGIVFSFSMLNLAKEVGGVFTTNFVNWFFLVGMVLFFGCVLAGMIIIQIKVKTPKRSYTRNVIVLLLATVFAISGMSAALFGISFSSFNEVAKSEDGLINYNDDDYLYRTQFISAKALRKFGVYGFYSVQVSNTFSRLVSGGARKMDEQTLAKIDKYFTKGQMSADAYGENIYTGSLNGKNLVVIVIESGEWYTINKEYTPTLYSIATQGISFVDYYARDKTNHSEAMSILGSYPGSSSGVTVSELNKKHTGFTLPNILSNAGYTANYFHANEESFYDRNITHGDDGIYGFDNAYFLENMFALECWDEEGEYVKDGFYDFDKDAKVMSEYFSEYTQKDEGTDAFYTLHMTLSSHGHYEDLVNEGDYPFADFSDERYYDADWSQEKKLAEQKKLQKEFSKEVLVKGFEKYYNIIDGYAEQGISPEKSIRLSADALEMDEEDAETLYLRYKRYQAGMMDLDEGLNSLIYDLQRSGQLGNTAFFLYADHSAYYDNLNYYLKNVPLDQMYNTNIYNIPCVLWYGGSMNCQTIVPEGFYEGYHALDFVAKKDLSSPLQGGVRVDKFVNSFDIIPTILHLMGINHNLRMYHGASMLTDKLGSVFVSLESGIFTDEYYYDGVTVSRRKEDGTWEQFDYEELTESEEGLPADVEKFLDDSLEYYTRQQIFDKIYRLDYYGYRSVYKQYEVEGKTFSFIK